MPHPDFLTASDEGVVLDVFVQPRAARNAIAGTHGGALKIKISAPPEEGRANEALREFLARTVGIPRARIAVLSGSSSRHKRILLEGMDPEPVARALSAEI